MYELLVIPSFLLFYGYRIQELLLITVIGLIACLEFFFTNSFIFSTLTLCLLIACYRGESGKQNLLKYIVLVLRYYILKRQKY